MPEGTGGRWFEAELHRLSGQYLITDEQGACASAEACSQNAIDAARKQQARMWNCAAASLARLWRNQVARPSPARAGIRLISKGFDTADLNDAKALLEQLA